jgi:hypothetical protein
MRRAVRENEFRVDRPLDFFWINIGEHVEEQGCLSPGKSTSTETRETWY